MVLWKIIICVQQFFRFDKLFVSTLASVALLSSASFTCSRISIGCKVP